jgi:hypothetical protein
MVTRLEPFAEASPSWVRFADFQGHRSPNIRETKTKAVMKKMAHVCKGGPELVAISDPRSPVHHEQRRRILLCLASNYVPQPYL